MRLLIVLITIAAMPAQAQYIAEILPTPNGTGRAVAAAGGQIVGTSFGVGGGPTLWNGPSHKFSLLNTGGYSSVQVNGVGGGTQVGFGISDTTRALMWSALGMPPIDLHPAAFLGSIANAADDNTQVGSVTPSQNISHAAMWSGSAQSVVVLHPAGYENSDVRGVSMGVQAGGIGGGPSPNGAVIWRGTAESMEFLPAPPGMTTAGAQGIFGNQVVGELSGGSGSIIWDLPTGTYSLLGPGRAMATNGVNQVGFEGFAFEERALLWSGNQSSRLDLHQFVPAGVNSSMAFGIDANGTIAGLGFVDGVGFVPLAWTPVPEPGSIFVIALGLFALCRSKRVSC